MSEGRIYWVEFKHPHFKWLETDHEFTTLQGAMDQVHTSRSAYPQRVVSQSISGDDRRINYRDPHKFQ